MPHHLGLPQPLLQVRDVARELGTTNQQLLPLATGLALHVSCPSSILTIEQAELLEAAWHSRTVPAQARGAQETSPTPPAAA